MDNRADLLRELGNDSRIGAASPDVEIVALAFERWQRASLPKFLGDWSLVVWNPQDRSLILAKDFLGVRPLFYIADEKSTTWSTVLESLVVLGSRSATVDREYLAGWLSFFPAAHLSPYTGVKSVPPSSCVMIRQGAEQVQQYWSFASGKTIRYCNDGEYEEHFRTAFGESVLRRLRADAPVLAELSGGLDSSTIVCVADSLIERRLAEAPRLDTISYYNDKEPNWDERPYFTIVEKMRGRQGTHIDVGCQEFPSLQEDGPQVFFSPSSVRYSSITHNQFAACLKSQGNRVLLSGIGGDEVLGGVPTPVPELSDLLADGQIGAFHRQLLQWALIKRAPIVHILLEVVQAFLSSALVPVPAHRRPPPWLRSEFRDNYRDALNGYERRLTFRGSRPSFQQNIDGLHYLQRQLGCSALSSDPLYESRYAYLDRSLLEFLFAIPSEQLVRPGQRRSLCVVPWRTLCQAKS